MFWEGGDLEPPSWLVLRGRGTCPIASWDRFSLYHGIGTLQWTEWQTRLKTLPSHTQPYENLDDSAPHTVHTLSLPIVSGILQAEHATRRQVQMFLRGTVRVEPAEP